MPPSFEQAIREHVGRYLAGELSLQDFDTWFVTATLDVEHSNEPRAEDLTWQIMLWFAEYSNGHRTQAELKELLRPIATPTAAGVASS